jgi:hypothetical protein
MRRRRCDERSGGSSARINCLRPAPVVESGSGTSSWRSGIEAEKRTVMRRSVGLSLVYGDKKGDAMVTERGSCRP